MLLPQKDNYLVAVHLKETKNKLVMAKTIIVVKYVSTSINAIHRNILKTKRVANHKIKVSSTQNIIPFYLIFDL